MFYRFARGLVKAILTFLFRFRMQGLHNVPEDGPVILCANHISLFDPPVVGIRVKRKVHFMAKEELFKVPLLGPIIRALGAYPVKRGGVSKESIRHSITMLREGQVLGIFPEGSRDAGGMGKKGAAMLAMKSGAAVVPVAIIGSYKLFRRMHVVYGPPVDLSEFAGGSSEQLEQATDKIMSVIHRMIAEYEGK